MRIVSAAFCKEIEQVSLSSLGTAKGLWLLSRWTGCMRKLQPAGQMNAVLALVADGIQVGERQQAKNLGPNLQKCEASAVQLSKH